ncbi:MAG: tRNA (adenosine(37)-N6)-dimethylallyltransferase MiaA [Gemmatimonadota bacterium]|nr:tRNA (adenosine(37)-N6)-dimethylallyltransferase MiaA [Gemmatimonadota bacterium]
MTRARIAIVGPTASGKTDLAIAVARALGGEIISADSRQAYRGFRVGTAAPTDEEVAAVPHHGVGILEPNERYGAGRFAELADTASRAIVERGNVPIVAGGTGLFIRALTHPMFREPECPPEVRERIRDRIDALPAEEVTRWALRLDPEEGERDQQRAARTIELVLLTGRTLGWWIEHGQPERQAFEGPVFAIDMPGELLRERIERRAEAMLESGAWEAEVRTLDRAGHAESRAFDALGYRDMQELVRGRIDRSEALERIIASTWAYARRQRTWFRHQLPERAVRLDGAAATDQLSQAIIREWRAVQSAASE